MHHYEVKRGRVVVDESRDDIGTVVEVTDNHVTIKPIRPDGHEWETHVKDIRLATPLERMQAKVAAENYASTNRLR